MKNVLTKNILIFVAIVLIIGSIFSLYSVDTQEVEKIDTQKLIQEINDEQVESVVIMGNMLELQLVDGTKQEVKKEGIESFSELLTSYNVSEEKISKFSREVKEEPFLTSLFKNMIGFVILFMILGVVFWFMMRQVQGANKSAMNFGQSRAREAKPNDKDRIRFKDVAGVIEAKEELMEIVEFLKYPKKFLELGAKIPRGALLMGAPGTGKTLLAKAVAGEAGVPFYSISGSEFVEMFVGVGASRVRDLFRKAKKNSPSIVFIDEIDAVGRQRGTGLGGSHDEREQTLNQILTEMDGFESHTNVIVIAATNRPDVLDPALLRPGRFDRRVIIDLPDINGREEILKIHSRNKPLADDVKLRDIAEQTPGFSGADLENLLNEGAIFAARQNNKTVSMSDILESIEKVAIGPARKSHLMTVEEKKITAYHEAGHALVGHMQEASDPIRKVTIISRGRALGYTMKLPEHDKKLQRRSEFIADLAMMLGGHTAEKEVFGEVTTGASNDLQQATDTARKLITRYGMSNNLVPRIYGEKDELVFLGKDISEKRNYSEKVAEAIDTEIDKLIIEAVETARNVLTDHRDKLDAVVAGLMKEESLDRKAFEAIVGPKPGYTPPKKQEPKKEEKSETDESKSEAGDKPEGADKK